MHPEPGPDPPDNHEKKSRPSTAIPPLGEIYSYRRGFILYGGGLG